MNAERLPSGKYRCRTSYTDPDGNRKWKSFTADTKKEAIYMASSFNVEQKIRRNCGETVKECLELYVDSKRNVLSPSTIAKYDVLVRNAYNSIGNINLDLLDNIAVQKWINSIDASPKTIRNRLNLIQGMLKMYRPDFILDVAVPKRTKVEYHICSDAEIKELVTATKGTTLGLAVQLAIMIPARRSELCALDATDVKNGKVTINKAMVQDTEKNWVIKQPKSYNGYRTVTLPNDLLKEIPKKGPVINLNPNALYKQFEKKIKELGLPHFRFHDLRHYGCTWMHSAGIPDQVICQRAGMDIGTLHNIYEHALPESVETAADIVNEKFNNLLS